MLTLKEQAKYLAMEYPAAQLDAALRELQDAQTKQAGAKGKIDLDAIQTVRQALHLRRVHERIRETLLEVGEGEEI